MQTNLQCPRPLVYSPALTQCVEPALAPAECAAWQQLKCAAECPRVLVTSTALALQLQQQALGCFWLRGSRDLNHAAYYENTACLTLSPYPALAHHGKHAVSTQRGDHQRAGRVRATCSVS